MIFSWFENDMKNESMKASPRWEMSKSIELGNYLLEKIWWEVIIIDVNNEKIPYISSPVVTMNYGYWKYEDLSSEDTVIADLQTKYIEQIKSVDNIIVAVPMRNFWMPAALKSWFDLVIKINDTFKIESWNYIWLVDNIKKAIVVWARWGQYIWTPAESYDQLTPQVNWLLWFMGIRNIENFWLEWVNVLDSEWLEKEKNELKNKMNNYLNV